MILFPNAKVNLGLNIVRKRPDGYHDIETLFYPVKGLCDILEFITTGGSPNTIEFSQSGLESTVILIAICVLRPTGCLPIGLECLM